MDSGVASELNLKQVANLLDVHYMAAYRYVRSGRLPARRVGTAWVVDADDVAALLTPSATGDESDLVRRLRDRLIEADEPGAWLVVESALVAGWEPESVLVDLVARAVYATDDPSDLASSRLAVVSGTRMSALLTARFRRRGRTRGSVVVGAPAGESHGFGLTVIADVLRLRNFTVLDLGTDVPAAVFVAAAERADRLTAVCVGVTHASHLDDARDVVTTLKSRLETTTVLAGGQAVASPEIAELSGADGWAADARGLAELIEGLVPKPTRQPVTA